MSMRVWFVGWTGMIPAELAECALRLPVAAMFTRPQERPRAVVLGDEVIARVDPLDARAALSPVGDRVIICAPNTDPGCVTPWRTAWVVDIVAARNLRQAIDRLTAPYVRPRFPPHEWLPTDLLRGVEAFDLASLVPMLPFLHVSAWARARGVSPRTLERTCRRVFGAAPKRILDLYCRAALADLTRQGATLDDCASALAMSGASSVSRTRRRLVPA